MWIKVFWINKEKLSYKDSLLRTLMTYIKWLALWLPIISILAMLKQYINLVSKDTWYNTSYDKEKYSVLYKKIWFLNFLLIIIPITIFLIPYSNITQTYQTSIEYEKYFPLNNNNNEDIKKEIPKWTEPTKVYENNFYSNLIKNEASLNKWLPYMVTNYIRLDKISLPWNNSIKYNYTYLNIQKSDISIEDTIFKLKSEIINWIVSNTDLIDYRDNKINFIYQYNDMNWVKLFEIPITSKDYNNEIPSNDYSTNFSDF
jgi:hypothetical protein